MLFRNILLTRIESQLTDAFFFYTSNQRVFLWSFKRSLICRLVILLKSLTILDCGWFLSVDNTSWASTLTFYIFIVEILSARSNWATPLYQEIMIIVFINNRGRSDSATCGAGIACNPIYDASNCSPQGRRPEHSRLSRSHMTSRPPSGRVELSS